MNDDDSLMKRAKFPVFGKQEIPPASIWECETIDGGGDRLVQKIAGFPSFFPVIVENEM